MEVNGKAKAQQNEINERLELLGVIKLSQAILLRLTAEAKKKITRLLLYMMAYVDTGIRSTKEKT